MNLKLIPTETFKKDSKTLVKSFPKLWEDLEKLQIMLLQNPKSGTSLGNNCYKIRLQNSSSKSGKSGGFRVITYFVDDEENIFLLTIYSKTHLDSISTTKLNDILIKNWLC